MIGRSSATARIAAIGGTRAAWRAGTTAETIVTIVPTSRPMITALGRSTTPLPGIWNPTAFMTALSPIDRPMPATTPTALASTPDDDRLTDHRREHLPLRRADRAQQRHLAHALRDDDRERVVDDEHPDDERDEREHEQRGADEAERLVDGVLVLLGERLAGDHLVLACSVRRQRVLDVLGDLRLRHAGLGDDGDLRELVRARSRPVAPRAGVNKHDRRAREAVDGAELRDADELVLLRRLRGEDRDLLADVEVALVGRLLVDDDLVVGCEARGPATRWNWLSFGFGSQPRPKVGGPFPPMALPLLSTACA